MKRLTYLIVCSLAIGSIAACKQESKFQVINGIVYDATMNNITLITCKEDTVNISTMDANRDKVCGVLLEDSVEVVCIKEKIEGKEILKVAELTIIKNNPINSNGSVSYHSHCCFILYSSTDVPPCFHTLYPDARS